MPARLDLTELSPEDLLARGIAAARVNETEEARDCLTEVTRRQPENADAWLWLASVETEPRLKRASFEKVLALRPGDPEAAAGLARLTERYGQSVLPAETVPGGLRCAWHPDRETGLTCTRCGRPICPACARHHPVGWRCPECAKELRSPLYKVDETALARALVVGLPASVGVAVLMAAIASVFWLLPLLLAVPAGTAVAELMNKASGRKRGRPMQLAAAGAVVVGALGVAMAGLLGVAPLGPIGPAIYAALGAGAAFRALR